MRIIPERDISMERAKSILTIAGSVKGTSIEVITTITRTKELLAFTRLEIKGATTPVEIPERSMAAMAYDG
ncbi:MAG: hypothetical protein H8D67_11660 [Deltaproteobacteria bacterium]|nr:hypothetical protein [Deltaproteobacteria bacterium]